jgi:hypothetical protein
VTGGSRSSRARHEDFREGAAADVRLRRGRLRRVGGHAGTGLLVMDEVALPTPVRPRCGCGGRSASTASRWPSGSPVSTPPSRHEWASRPPGRAPVHGTSIPALLPRGRTASPGGWGPDVGACSAEWNVRSDVRSPPETCAAPLHANPSRGAPGAEWNRGLLGIAQEPGRQVWRRVGASSGMKTQKSLRRVSRRLMLWASSFSSTSARTVRGGREATRRKAMPSSTQEKTGSLRLQLPDARVLGGHLRLKLRNACVSQVHAGHHLPGSACGSLPRRHRPPPQQHARSILGRAGDLNVYPTTSSRTSASTPLAVSAWTASPGPLPPPWEEDSGPPLSSVVNASVPSRYKSPPAPHMGRNTQLLPHCG